MMEMQTGTVKWLNCVKGFGFIRPEGGGKALYMSLREVHPSSEIYSLTTGQRVAYLLARGPKGMHARHVKVL